MSSSWYSLVLAVQTPNDRHRDIPRGGKGAMSHTLTVMAHGAPLNRKPVGLFVFRERRVAGGADGSTAGRRQRHAGWESPQAEETEGGDED